VGELPEEAASALRRSRMDRRHAHIQKIWSNRVCASSADG
jgi:hypothetical protein